MRKSGWTLLAFIFIGGLLGGVLGEILRVFTPPGTIQNIFSRAVSPGLDPPFTVDLVLIAAPVEHWQTAATLPLLARISGPKTVVFFLEEDIWRRFEGGDVALASRAA